MQDPFKQENRKKRKSNFFLRVDSWIDSSLWSSAFKLGQIWEEITIFFRRFKARGFYRVLFELLGEGMTWGTVGMVLMLALAMPAFDLTNKNWRTQDNFAVTFLDRYGNEIGHRGVIHADSVPIDELPDHVLKAVLATEDRRFFEHYGIDFFGLIRAMSENVRANSVVQGGSTITQQLAKNLFLTNERTLERKINEAFLALWLETNLSKKEILRLYLDRAYMGGGTFGVSAASKFYFGKHVRDVSLAEAAMMAGLFKAPARYAPHINLPAARGRANEVLTNLVQSKLMTEGQVIGARRSPASIVDRGQVESPDYFLDWAFERVKKVARDIKSHSFVVRTTLDTSLQDAAEKAMEASLRQHGKRYRVKQGAIVLIEHGGAVRAMVGGRDYGSSQFNRAARAKRQPGSSFKMFVYATAMENGFTPQSRIVDGPITWRGWSPRNYGRSYRGRVDLTTALVKSVNTIPVRLARDHLGTTKIAEKAVAMGVETTLRVNKTMPLGTSEITPLDMATAYAVLPAGGLEANRHGISQIIDYDGKILFDINNKTEPLKRVLTEKASKYMNEIMTQIPVWGTGRRAKLDNIVTAGKTGTTQAYRDGWFVGYTGNFTAAVWFGNDDFTSSNRMTGGSLPAMTFKRLMTFAHHGIELRSIPGIDTPQSNDEIKTANAEGSDKKGEEQIVRIRQRSLSTATTDILRRLVKELSTVPDLYLTPKTSTSSANKNS